MDCGGDIAGVPVVLRPHGVNVPVGLAATLLRGEAVLRNLTPQAGESGEHGRILGIEPITQTLLNALNAPLQAVDAELVADIGPCESAVHGAIAASEAAPAKDHGEDDDGPPPVTAEHTVIVAVSVSAERIAGCKIVVHM